MRCRLPILVVSFALTCVPAQAQTWSPATPVPGAAGVNAHLALLPAGDTVLGWGFAGSFSRVVAPPAASFGPVAAYRLTPGGPRTFAWDGATAPDGTGIVLYGARMPYERVREQLVGPDGRAARPRSISTSGHTARYARIAVASDGSAVAAWTRYAGGGRWQVEVSTRNVTGGFVPAATIDVPGRTASFSLAVGAAPGRTGVVAWTTRLPGRQRGPAPQRLHVVVIRSGVAGPRQDVGTEANWPLAAAVNADGTAVVAAARYIAYADQGVDSVLLRPGHAPVTAALSRGGNVLGLSAGIDSGGTATVAWAEFGTPPLAIAPVRSATAGAGDTAFGTAQELARVGGSGAVSAPVLAERDDGAALLTWADGTHVLAAARGAGAAAFGAPATLSPDQHTAIDPVPAIGADGRLAVAWEDFTDQMMGDRPIWLASAAP